MSSPRAVAGAEGELCQSSTSWTDATIHTEQALEGLLEQALRVVRELRFRVQETDEFFDYLSNYGCQSDGKMVWFPAAVIDKVVRIRARSDRRRRCRV